VPKVVTVMLYPEGYPAVSNHYELVRLLEELTEPYGFKVSRHDVGPCGPVRFGLLSPTVGCCLVLFGVGGLLRACQQRLTSA
jgi:hypothetical protein